MFPCHILEGPGCCKKELPQGSNILSGISIFYSLIANTGLLRKIYIDFKVGSLWALLTQTKYGIKRKNNGTPIISSAQGSRENLFFNCCLQSISLEAQLHVPWSGRRIWKKKRSDHWSVDLSTIEDGINVFPPTQLMIEALLLGYMFREKKRDLTDLFMEKNWKFFAGDCLTCWKERSRVKCQFTEWKVSEKKLAIQILYSSQTIAR